VTYQETIDYLIEQVPMFQQVGSSAYKEGLFNTLELDKKAGHPHTKYRTIHVAGTNGKGSVSHTLAAVLQSAGYRVGLYTSPHLIDFRERIRVNGKPISKETVVKYIEDERPFFEPLHPSFFEVTTAMAFAYFESQKVDVAVIEVGLGGRLDCTNIIRPDLSIITNIGLDHVKFLGDTLAKIAFEKAGIIKKGVPVIIGEDCEETRPVFENKAKEYESPIVFAQDKKSVKSYSYNQDGALIYDTDLYPNLSGELKGYCQHHNANTILTAIKILNKSGYNISEAAVRQGFSSVCELTGLRGRWQTLADAPKMVCDTGHNVHGLTYIAEHLKQISSKPEFGKLRIVIGMVDDKDIEGVLKLMPQNAIYYFTQASVKRALDATKLGSLAHSFGLQGNCYKDVSEAVAAAREESDSNDLIYIGGSTFIVADLFTLPEFSYEE
jgi:dihydrofolate synthase / folylpolyglutamate synthase